ncbi:uncharacterized protein LOC105394586 [Plutella xylostella]|uniref:uncharacterized protein LOC105394586 n=1 Tax=Plutella xylostella TaxID=51655 RepID=UPI0020322DE8|nr:uncharacterized protein LOC105394586 [Plutella xylostella]
MNNHLNEDTGHVLDTTIAREQFERLASAATASQTLEKLNISASTLPSASRGLMVRLAAAARGASPGPLGPPPDPAGLALRRAAATAQALDDDYQILTLQHKIKEVQLKINRNAKFISSLTSTLSEARGGAGVAGGAAGVAGGAGGAAERLAADLRAHRHKLTAYKDSADKAKNKYSMLEVAGELEPGVLREGCARAAAAAAAAARWARAAEDTECTRRLRQQTLKLQLS